MAHAHAGAFIGKLKFDVFMTGKRLRIACYVSPAWVFLIIDVFPPVLEEKKESSNFSTRDRTYILSSYVLTGLLAGRFTRRSSKPAVE